MKYVAGPIAFLLSAAASAALTFVTTPVPDPPLPPPASLEVEPSYVPPGSFTATQIAFYPDRRVVVATIRRSPHRRAAPGVRTWVMFSLEPSGETRPLGCTEPVALDFADGRDEVTVTARAPWVGPSDDLTSGCFARMMFSASMPTQVWHASGCSESGRAVRYPVVVYGAR